MIWLDARNGFSPNENLAYGINYSGLRDVFLEQGSSLQPAFSFEAIPKDVSAVVIMQSYERDLALSFEEINALVEFTNAGGALLVLAEGGDGTRSAYLGNLSVRYGVGIGSTSTEPAGHIITGPYSNHRLTEGIDTVGVDFQRRLSTTDPAIDLTQTDGANDFMAVSGRAVFISDAGMFSNGNGADLYNLTFGDNRKLLSNISEFIAVPEPIPASASVLLAIGFVVRLLVRKRSPSST